MPRNAKYGDLLCYWMTFAHNRDLPRYTKVPPFWRQQLLQLKPHHIHNWLVKRAYHKMDYNIDAGDRPIHAKFSAIKFVKTTVSFFTPDNASHRCDVHGNPTKHQMHRTLIDDIKKGQSLEWWSTFLRQADTDSAGVHQIAWDDLQSWSRKAGGVQVFVSLSCHDVVTISYLICEIDDVETFAMGSPMGKPQFLFALKTKVQWSKNVKDEAVCHPQLLLGLADRWVKKYAHALAHAKSNKSWCFASSNT